MKKLTMKNILKTIQPIKIESFLLMNYREDVTPSDIAFLRNWREHALQDKIFLGWNTIENINLKHRLLKYAKSYTDYLYDWSIFNEGLLNQPHHVTDDSYERHNSRNCS